MDGYIIPIISLSLSIAVNVLYHSVIFANKFGKIEEKLNQIEKYKKDIDSLDRRVNNFNAEIGLIKHSLENLDKEVGNMRSDMLLMIQQVRDEQRESFKDQKEDTKDAVKQLQKSIEKIGDRI
jgi:chromosome segregation ATPase